MLPKVSGGIYASIRETLLLMICSLKIWQKKKWQNYQASIGHKDLTSTLANMTASEICTVTSVYQQRLFCAYLFEKEDFNSSGQQSPKTKQWQSYFFLKTEKTHCISSVRLNKSHHLKRSQTSQSSTSTRMWTPYAKTWRYEMEGSSTRRWCLGWFDKRVQLLMVSKTKKMQKKGKTLCTDAG